jgi:hypothetical protein
VAVAPVLRPRRVSRAIDGCLDLGAGAQRAIEASPELELLSPQSLGIVTFRRRPPDVDDEAVLERINAALVERIQADGRVFLSTAWVRGRFALRLCILNHSTTTAEVERALELAATLPVDTALRVAVASYPPLERGWLRRPQLDVEAVRALPLFAPLDDAQAARVLRDSHEHLAVPGEPIVQRWQVSRDLFVVLEGVVEVRVDNAVVRMLGPGEFFGEVAALDWGAGYGRTRTATVSAVEETRLLVLDRQLVHDLVRSSPAVGDLLDDAAKSRLRPART